MSKFVEASNLPKKAKELIIGEAYREILEAPLKACGLHPLFLPDNRNIDARLAGHADLSVLHAGGARIFLAPHLRGSAFFEALKELGMDIAFAEIEQRPDYPNDVQLNLCIAGEYVLCRRAFVPESIEKYLTNEKKHILINCRQGYARCAVCIVGEGSIITADAGAAASAEAQGLDVLKIENGFFHLPGFEYGFIGGSCFKISESELAFTGRINGHPNENEILAFLRYHRVAPVFLTDLPAFDIGSAIPITEKQRS